ncbi:hypothetical protein M885DRAFT_579302 [Pelagophyceae sp. CCMP2097]|nr:hypothetical protein M885DRAFT_579302 [Pelagophyceae sp. CCMP2097]
MGTKKKLDLSRTVTDPCAATAQTPPMRDACEIGNKEELDLGRTVTAPTPGNRDTTSDAKTPDAKTPHAKTPDANMPDATHAKAPADGTSHAKTSDAKTPDGKTSDAKTPDATPAKAPADETTEVLVKQYRSPNDPYNRRPTVLTLFLLHPNGKETPKLAALNLSNTQSIYDYVKYNIRQSLTSLWPGLKYCSDGDAFNMSDENRPFKKYFKNYTYYAVDYTDTRCPIGGAITGFYDAAHKFNCKKFEISLYVVEVTLSADMSEKLDAVLKKDYSKR